ncbi:aminopeptidase [Halorhabdus sp. BNX81]|uniref:aminopeptidase n=1 Tax=Halorhabdus sp. BNX81 TaxID=2980181 RepID=UPI0023DD56A0|nr:aminopeptidase [Halorhabdus sp. BNX81]WEL22688.1 Leucyl aminopeptidase (aminopeptidase T) [Halorhabdus sp. BNX81]
MDPRIREHAQLIADAVDLSAGDNFLIKSEPAAEDLVVALYEIAGDRGAHPVSIRTNRSGRAIRSYLQAADAADVDFETPAHEQALVEAADCHAVIRSHANVTELEDVPPEVNSDYEKAHQPILNERLTDRWTLTQHPTPADAQLAEMSTEAYENFVYDAILKDWDEQREFQAQLVEILEDASEVRIVSGDTTDVTMSVDGNHVINDTDTHNLPGGEVFTAPVPDSVEGNVLFDKPVYRRGREITDARLVFEDGEVVEHSASKNEELLTSILDTDDGARRLGELGIGMNRDIDRFTYNMLFDEKMGDTVHMAVGRAYEDNVGEGNEQNESAQHVDMIVDMSEDSFIEVDGEVVQEDGTFVFEDGFEE